MVVCLGCAAIFHREGDLRSHYQQSTDPRCVAIRISQGRLLQTAYIEDEEEDEGQDADEWYEDEGLLDAMDVDPVGPPPQFPGDMYGDDYDSDDFPGLGEDLDLDPTVNEGPETEGNLHDDILSGDEDDYVYAPFDFSPLVSLSNHLLRYDIDDRTWEPRKIPAQLTTASGQPASNVSQLRTLSETPPPLPTHAISGRRAVEDALRKHVYVHSFPSNIAGAGVKSGNSANLNHMNTLQDAPANSYAPFKDHFNWEIARWAKMQGPGSTAVTELLQIPGVSTDNYQYILIADSILACNKAGPFLSNLAGAQRYYR